MVVDLTDAIVRLHLNLEAGRYAVRHKSEAGVTWAILDRPRLWVAMRQALGAERANVVGVAMATRPETARIHAMIAALEPTEIAALGDWLLQYPPPR